MNKQTLAAVEKWKKIEEEGRMVCTKCKKVQLLTKFTKRKDRSYGGYYNHCHTCNKTYSANYIKKKFETVEGRLHSCINNARNRRGKWSKSVDLTVPFLYSLYKKQEGLCFYTKKPMYSNDKQGSKWDIISIDRIDSSKGYTEDNIVLCRWIVNYMKQDIDLATFKQVVSELHDKL